MWSQTAQWTAHTSVKETFVQPRTPSGNYNTSGRSSRSSPSATLAAQALWCSDHPAALHRASRPWSTERKSAAPLRADFQCAHAGRRPVAMQVRAIDQKLCTAAAKGKISEVHSLLQQGEGNPQVLLQGRTLLHLIANVKESCFETRSRDCDTAVDELIAAGIDVDATDAKGWTPLHHASFRGHIDIITTLLRQKANIAAECPMVVTPLHIAAQLGHIFVATILLKHGAPSQFAPNSRCMGWSPLHCAADNGQVEMLAQLLTPSTVNVEDSQGWTPLHVALCDKEHIAIWIRANDNWERVDRDVYAFCDGLPGREYLQNYHREEDLLYDIDEVLERQQTSCVHALLRANAEVDKTTTQGWSPLHCAISQEWKYDATGKGNCMSPKKSWCSTLQNVSPKMLFGHTCAAYNSRTRIFGGTSFIEGLYDCDFLVASVPKSTESGMESRLKALLDHHADVNISDRTGRSPLHYAVASGFGIDLLLSHGAHINAVDFNGVTPSTVCIPEQIQRAVYALNHTHKLQIHLASQATEHNRQQLEKVDAIRLSCSRTAWPPRELAMMHALEDLQAQAEAAQKTCAQTAHDAHLALMQEMQEGQQKLQAILNQYGSIEVAI